MPRREQLQSMLAADPEDPFLLYALAMEDRKAGDADAAMAGLQAVLTRNADYVAAYFQKAQLLNELDRTTEACETLRAGIAVAERVGDDHAAGEMTGYLDMLE